MITGLRIRVRLFAVGEEDDEEEVDDNDAEGKIERVGLLDWFHVK